MIRSASTPAGIGGNDHKAEYTTNLPPAGHFREALHVHRELMARAGSQIASWQAMSQHIPRPSPDPSLKMSFSRGAPDFFLESDAGGEPDSVQRTGLLPGQEIYAIRPAGVSSIFQTAKTRSEFKEHAVLGQFSNALLPAHSPSKKLYQSIRCMNQTYVTHNKRIPALRLERERRMGIEQ